MLFWKYYSTIVIFLSKQIITAAHLSPEQWAAVARCQLRCVFHYADILTAQTPEISSLNENACALDGDGCHSCWNTCEIQLTPAHSHHETTQGLCTYAAQNELFPLCNRGCQSACHILKASAYRSEQWIEHQLTNKERYFDIIVYNNSYIAFNTHEVADERFISVVLYRHYATSEWTHLVTTLRSDIELRGHFMYVSFMEVGLLIVSLSQADFYTAEIIDLVLNQRAPLDSTKTRVDETHRKSEGGGTTTQSQPATAKPDITSRTILLFKPVLEFMFASSFVFGIGAFLKTVLCPNSKDDDIADTDDHIVRQRRYTEKLAHVNKFVAKLFSKQSRKTQSQEKSHSVFSNNLDRIEEEQHNHEVVFTLGPQEDTDSEMTEIRTHSQNSESYYREMGSAANQSIWASLANTYQNTPY